MSFNSFGNQVTYMLFAEVLEATPYKAPTIRPPTSHHENYPS